MKDFCQILGPSQKALEINLTPEIYGIFAEIGAGQEVVRHFFRAGGAAGTIAKTISAYDMTVSDIIYGKGGRYVSYERLKRMLSRELNQLLERLTSVRDQKTTFFTFANTVSAKSYLNNTECHGWMGVRFQHAPGAGPSQIILHVEMLDRENVQQQEAIGNLGVNLIYSCFFNRDEHSSFIRSLMDGLSTDRIQIDMVKVEGPAFAHMDNRILALNLVKNGYCRAIMFNCDGTVVQVKDEVYKKNLLVVRGSFRPPTLVNLDMMKTGQKHLEERLKGDDDKAELLVLAEMSMNQLLERGEVKSQDFLARVDLLAGLNQSVLISNYENFYELNLFLAQANKNHHISFVTGVYNLLEIFDTETYQENPGQILEELGKLFGKRTDLLVYPSADDDDPKKLLTSREIQINETFEFLIKYLKANDFISDSRYHDPSISWIWSRTVLDMIQNQKKDWEKMVPQAVAKMVKEKKLFGYKPL